MAGMTINRIGVIGAGQMGGGIAQVMAHAGYDVTMQDVSTERTDAGLAAIRNSLERLARKQAIDAAQMAATLSRIATATDVTALADCDLVIEAAPEREDLKRAIFAGLAPILRDGAILATNTSSLSVTRLAASAPHPERFVGVHFMNPVPLMALVEVIPGLGTNPATLESVAEVVARIGKTQVVSADRPGFVVNRILIPMVNEAVFVLAENVADAASIDAAMTLGGNMPIGPLKLADLIGLDTCLAIMRVLHRELGEDKYRPCPLLAQYVDAGWLGRKSGRGFFTYP
jgi:3-hydroxybutyryl-CoA dehydrogenase